MASGFTMKNATDMQSSSDRSTDQLSKGTTCFGFLPCAKIPEHFYGKLQRTIMCLSGEVAELQDVFQARPGADFQSGAERYFRTAIRRNVGFWVSRALESRELYRTDRAGSKE